MSRLIFVPQCPIHMRYQDWWFYELPANFENYYDEVLILGDESLAKTYSTTVDSGEFSAKDAAIQFELDQIDYFMNLKLHDDDTLFLADLSFPGFFTNVLHHKPIENAYAFCHATSMNNHDYFEPVRNSKWLVETGHSEMFKKIFVGSEYHKDKLGWSSIEVVGVPEPPFIIDAFTRMNKTRDIISVARDNVQKVTSEIEYAVEKLLGRKIHRKKHRTWKGYYKYIAESKIMLITSKEETFGYSTMEAIINGCIPIAPNKFSYPELLPRKYLYNDEVELEHILFWALENGNYYKVPELLNKNLVDNFYKNVANIMKEG